jgi:hypothetical protein
MKQRALCRFGRNALCFALLKQYAKQHDKSKRGGFYGSLRAFSFCPKNHYKTEVITMSRKYTNATQNTRVYDKFEYHLDDLDCQFCANFRNRGGHGCGRSVCEFEDIKREAIANGRIKRKRGWNKWAE